MGMSVARMAEENWNDDHDSANDDNYLKGYNNTKARQNERKRCVAYSLEYDIEKTKKNPQKL